MDAKTFEVLDRGTFIPVLAVRLEPGCGADLYLLARAGYGLRPEVQGGYVVLVRIEGRTAAEYDPVNWGLDGTRTLRVAHAHVINHWAGLQSGAVIDVEYVLGETAAPKRSEAEDADREGVPWTG